MRCWSSLLPIFDLTYQSTVSLSFLVDCYASLIRGIEWSHSVEKSSLNLAFAELLTKISRVLGCSNSQNFCFCSYARILVKIPVWQKRKTWENAHALNVSGDMHPRFSDVIFKLTHVTVLLERHP